MVDVLRYRTDEAVGDPGVTVDSFANQTNASAVRLEPGDDARAPGFPPLPVSSADPRPLGARCDDDVALQVISLAAPCASGG